MSKRARLAKKLEAAGLWGPRAYAGYTDWRYGQQKPITLANVAKAKKIVSRDRRRHIVGKTMDVLRDWRLSPFEFEGAVRHALRSGFCLDGHPWGGSDSEAAGLLAEALRRLGAERPTWDEGQPEHVKPREECAWCSGPVPGDLVSGGRIEMKFCSAECARKAVRSRNYYALKRESKGAAAAEAILKRAKADLRICAHCHKSYRPIEYSPTPMFCSQECHSAARKPPPMSCEECGRDFILIGARKRDQARFCSMGCYHRNRVRTASYAKDCSCCGESFLAKSPKALYCSKPCLDFSARFAAGKLPKKLTAPAFDFVMRMAA